jgi:transposase-like protein
MTKNKRMERARELRALGRSYSEIALELGVGVGTVHRWVNPESAERCRRKAREWKAAHPDEVRALELARRDASGECLLCGSACLGEACRGCIGELAARRQALAIEMWNEGADVASIATRAGFTPGTLKVRIIQWRKEGLPVAYRYPPDRVRSMRAACGVSPVPN